MIESSLHFCVLLSFLFTRDPSIELYMKSGETYFDLGRAGCREAKIGLFCCFKENIRWKSNTSGASPYKLFVSVCMGDHPM